MLLEESTNPAELSAIEPVRNAAAAGALAAAAPAGGGGGEGKVLKSMGSKWGVVRKKVDLTPVLSAEDWEAKASALAQVGFPLLFCDFQ